MLSGRWRFASPVETAQGRRFGRRGGCSRWPGRVGADIAAGPATKAGAAVGLTFWADGSDDTQTLFLIDPTQGSFAIDSEVADKLTAVLDWGTSSLIQTATGSTNRLEVVADGKLARFIINGHQVAQMAVPSKLPGGLIGLYAAGSDTDPGDFGFSNFSAKIPVESALPPGTAAAPATAPGKTIFADDFNSLDPSWGVTGAASSATGRPLEVESGSQRVGHPRKQQVCLRRSGCLGLHHGGARRSLRCSLRVTLRGRGYQ